MTTLPGGARRRTRLLVLSLAGGLAIGLVAALAFRDNGPSAPSLRGPTFPTGLRAPDFTLRDQDGRLVSLHDYRLKVVVVTFLSTRCADPCPTMVAQIRGALDTLRRPVPVLAITADPGHDKPSVAAEFVRMQRLTGRMRFLLGTEAQLEPVWRSYAFSPQRNGEEQPSFVNLVDKAGRQRVGYPASHLTSDDLAHDIEVLEAEKVRVARR
jgi:protein SCO1/2